ncbi:Elastase inhibitor AFLEI Flags: Precursor [Luteimonas aestuarii]|uniref:Peptidase inhibitor I78 family protein n=1 Tax=Luteimonas aestuarii TaxID=453837 RepID=A0A4V3ALP7_9GAMM|nr:Elastase inhibitor AFLEI Flags: Precursor [Luteimonas aestuarii]
MSLTRNALAAGLATLLSLTVVGCARDDAGTAATPDTTAPAPADAAPAPVDPVATDMPPAMGTCNADAVQSLVGQASSDAVTEQARIDSGAASVRVLSPGDAATMDYREDRLNIMLDADGVIESVRCG